MERRLPKVKKVFSESFPHQFQPVELHLSVLIQICRFSVQKMEAGRFEGFESEDQTTGARSPLQNLWMTAHVLVFLFPLIGTESNRPSDDSNRPD